MLEKVGLFFSFTYMVSTNFFGRGLDITSLWNQAVHRKTNLVRDTFIDTLDMVSVYRNFTLFSQIGLAQRFQGGRYSLYEHKHQENETTHHHAYIMMNCHQYGMTKEIEQHSQEICDTASRLKKYSQSWMRFGAPIIQGKCNDCVKAT